MITTMETLQPDDEALRFKLRVCAFIMVVCGILGIIGSLAVYYYGFILGILFFFAAGTTIVHTKSQKDVYQNTCCFNNINAFVNLKTLFIVCCIGSGIGILFSVAGLYFHLTSSGTQTSVILAVCALTACVVGTPVSGVAAGAAGTLHISIQPAFVFKPLGGPGGGMSIVPGSQAPTEFQQQQVYPAAIPIDPNTGQPFNSNQQQHQPQQEYGQVQGSADYNDGGQNGYYYNNVQQQPVKANNNNNNNY